MTRVLSDDTTPLPIRASVILAFDLHLLMPLSLVDENMDRAHARGACAHGKFWFRRKLVPDDHACPSVSAAAEPRSRTPPP